MDLDSASYENNLKLRINCGKEEILVHISTNQQIIGFRNPTDL